MTTTFDGRRRAFSSSLAYYETYTVEQLKNFLRDRGLKVSGRKQELIERLASSSSSTQYVPVVDDVDDDEYEESDWDEEEEDWDATTSSSTYDDDFLHHHSSYHFLHDNDHEHNHYKPEKEKKKKKPSKHQVAKERFFQQLTDLVQKHQPVDLTNIKDFQALFWKETNQKWKPKATPRKYNYRNFKTLLADIPAIQRKVEHNRVWLTIKPGFETTSTNVVSEQPPNEEEEAAAAAAAVTKNYSGDKHHVNGFAKAAATPDNASLVATNKTTYNQINGYDDRYPSFVELATLRQFNGEGGGGGGDDDDDEKNNGALEEEEEEDATTNQESMVMDGKEFAKLRTALSINKQRPRVYLSSRSTDFAESALLGYMSKSFDNHHNFNDDNGYVSDHVEEVIVQDLDDEKSTGKDAGVKEEDNDEAIFLNTHDPFCLATVGVQGAGKSHTLASVLESCLLPANPVVRLNQPMTALVLHYDLNISSICGVAGLLSPSSRIPNGPKLDREKAVVLVSPTFYQQRKEFYGDYVKVRPLLLKWSSLTADHIKRIMGIRPGDNQLYVASFMTLLRSYQRGGSVPSFGTFVDEVRALCNFRGQQAPLEQRIALLESIVAEADGNQDILNESVDIEGALASDLQLIIADLTDPLLSKEEANGLFQVITEQFRTTNTRGGKVLALDEAHKFMDGVASDGLSESIVDAARLMRHDGMRLVVSTQSPTALAPELLELVSVAIMHQFHSHDWWSYLQHKLPMPSSAFKSVLSLTPGNAMVFASRSTLPTNLFGVEIRPRLTADFGSSRTN